MKAKIWKTLIATGFVLLVMWILTEDHHQSINSDEQQAIMLVSTLEVNPQNTAFSVETTGVTWSRWPTETIASFSGRIKKIPDLTEPGNLVKAGQSLVDVFNSSYESDVAAVQARVARAELELSRMKHEQHVKKQISVGTKLTSFGRLEPHVKATEAELSAAKSALIHVQQLLEDTLVKAPFDAVILDKKVSPGQWVNNGDVLLAIAASNFIDVQVELSATQWYQLDNLAVGTEVHVTDPRGQVWPGKIRYLSPIMNAATRQRSLMLEVPNPYEGEAPLLPGQQVDVKFKGMEQNDVVVAPASVLTQDGQVWSVNGGVLNLENIQILNEQAESVTFRYLQKPQKARTLVLYPLSTMLTGQRVKVQKRENNS